MRLRVLVVDDAVSAREHIRAILEAAEMTVVAEATNGVEAVARYRELRPDLITMDLVMPQMNGIEATRAILEVDSNARVIAVSGLSQPSVMADADAAGIMGFVPKPVDAPDLLREIRDVLTR